MNIKATANSSFTKGQRVYGKYCSVSFVGKLNDSCRSTADGRNLIFGIDLDAPIFANAQYRSSIEIQTNGINTVYFC